MNYYEEKNFTSVEFESIQPFKASEFVNCTFELIDFTPINLSLSKFFECKFIKCNLSNISLKNTSFRDVTFTECKLLGLNWAETQTLASPIFTNSILDFSVFQSMKLNELIIKDCSVKEADFYETSLAKSNFSGSNLSKSNFNKANLSEADFRNASDYFIDLKITNVKKAKFNMPEALNLLRGLEIILE